MELNTDLSRNYYKIDDEHKTVIVQMVLETIKNISNFKVTEDSDKSRYDIGTNFTEVPFANAYIIETILTDLGYKQDDFDENGWEMDFWIHYQHKNPNYPPLCISGTGITKEIYLRGEYEDYKTYEQHRQESEKFEEEFKKTPEYANIIKRVESMLGEKDNEQK